jgi:hypothetical protein
MRAVMQKIGQFFAELERSLNAMPVFRQLTAFAVVLCSPVVGLARGTLRALPFMRKLEWLLEIELLTRRHPVILALTMAYVAWRGLQTTPLGHIGTDRMIYPFLGAVGGFNPFLGFCCGIIYGAGDIVQKLLMPDMYGARGWGDPNYWGALAGYVVAYSSLMIMGLFPGMLSRVFRVITRSVVKKVFFSRASATADGALPIPGAEYPLAELIAAVAGAGAGGWVVMHEVAPITESPAFFWRPNPDVSCHMLEVNTHLLGRAPVGGAGSAVGAVAPVLIPPPVPDEFEWTAPNGVTYVVRKNDQGQWINILTGGEVDVSNLDKWKQTTSDNISSQQAWSEAERAKQQARDGWFDHQMDQMVADQKNRAKILDNLGKIEKGILFGDGPESELYRPPGTPGNVLDQVHAMQQQILDGKTPDLDRLQRVYNVYKDQKNGSILQTSQLPTQGQLDRDVLGDTVSNTVKEVVTGTKADGTTSWLGMAGRALIGVATGGGSEFVMVPANAVDAMKTYVNAGGNSVLGGFAVAVTTVITDELTGRAVGGALHVGSVVGGVGKELVKEAAENGSSLAKGLLNAAEGAAAKGGQVVAIFTTPIGMKPPNLGTGVKAPRVPVAPSAATVARNNARAGSTGVTVKPAGIDPSKVANGITAGAEKQVKMVAANRGVIIDVRPTNPLTKELIQSGKAVPKPSFVKTKTLTPADKLLGAKGEPGMVGFYKPKLPPQGNMSNEAYEGLKKLNNTRLKEFNDNFKELKGLRDQGKVYVKDGVVHSGQPPTGKPFTGDNDIFDIRDPVTGQSLPRYQVDPKGNVMMDAKTGQPMLNPVREAVLKDLSAPPFNNQHGAHMDWKYDHASTSVPSGSPPGAQSPFEKYSGIDKNVLDKHRPGGEPLVNYGADGQVSTGFVQGGR